MQIAENPPLVIVFIVLILGLNIFLAVYLFKILKVTKTKVIFSVASTNSISFALFFSLIGMDWLNVLIVLAIMFVTSIAGGYRCFDILNK